MGQRANDRVLNQVLCFGQASGPDRQASPGPPLERRKRTFDQLVHGFGVALLESLEQVDCAGESRP